MDSLSVNVTSVAIGAVATVISRELLQNPEIRGALMRQGKPVLVFAAKSAFDAFSSKLGSSSTGGLGPAVAG